MAARSKKERVSPDVVAFLFSIFLTLAMVGVVLYVAKRRTPGTPLTWGEAFVGAVFVFALFVLLFGVVPNQWLLWADNELGWRKDKLGIPTGSLPFKDHTVFAGGLKAFGLGNLPWMQDTALAKRGAIVLTAEHLRDVIAAGIYIVGLVATFFGMSRWQKRGTRTADPSEKGGTSAFGRPLIKGA